MQKSEIKYRPILFSEPMVRAILQGRKTQTRRIIKNPIGDGSRQNPFRMDLMKFPYGKVGDRLWVREAFSIREERDINGDMHPIAYFRENVPAHLRGEFKWKPSIHMPRWAFRITLEIKNVRLERLQDRTENDAKAEGCDKAIDHPLSIGYYQSFETLWKDINGKESWDQNPLVWVIEFERIEE